MRVVLIGAVFVALLLAINYGENPLEDGIPLLIIKSSP
jgi:hypothetical protein